MKEPFGRGRRAQHAHGDPARGFAEDRDPRRVPAKRRDIALNPPEAGHHVEQAVVAGRVRRRFRTQLGVREEPRHAHTVGEAHKDDAARGQFRAVVHGVRRGAAVEAAAVDPHEHRQLRGGGRRRGPDVQVQAVLAQAARRRTAHRLHARRSEPVRTPHAGPCGHRLRRPPAEVADGRRRERDALVHGQTAFGDTLDQPAVDLDGPIRRARQHGRQREQHRHDNERQSPHRSTPGSWSALSMARLPRRL